MNQPSREAALRTLLTDCFALGELERFVGTIDAQVASSVTWNQAAVLVVADVMGALQRYGVVTSLFWDRFVESRPNRKDEIRRVRAVWSADAATGNSPTAGDSDGTLIPSARRLDQLYALRSELGANQVATDGVDEEIVAEERQLRLGMGIEIGATIAGYRLLELVDEPLVGSCWRAWHAGSKRLAALKLSAGPPMEKTHSFVLHPNVLEVLPSDPSDPSIPAGMTVHATEWLRWPSLRAWRAAESLSLATADRWLSQLVAALGAIHGAGLLHGGISPDCIGVASDGAAKLGDPAWMWAPHGKSLRLIDARRRLVYTDPDLWTAGTPIMTQSADIYSLGMVFAWLMIGEEPLIEEPLSRLAWMRDRLDGAPRITRFVLEATDSAARRPRFTTDLVFDKLDDLEAIILTRRQPRAAKGYLPAIHLDVEGHLCGPFDPSVAWVESHREKIERVISSMGMMLAGPEQKYFALAVLVAPDLVATPRHALGSLDYFVGSHVGDVGPGVDLPTPTALAVRVGVDPSSPPVKITRISLVHPVWNIAFLRLERPVGTPIRLLSTPPSADGHAVVVGRPNLDKRMEESVQRDLTGDVFDQFMVFPGTKRGIKHQFSFSREVDVLATYVMQGVGGGAPVIDLDTGDIAGFTFGAQYLVASYAVPAWRLRQDARVRALGIAFSEAPEASPDPVVEDAWRELETKDSEPRELE